MHSIAQASGSALFVRPPQASAGGETKDRPQPFAAGEKRITHRLVDRRGLGRSLRQKTVERAIHLLLARAEIARQIHSAANLESLGRQRNSKLARSASARPQSAYHESRT